MSNRRSRTKLKGNNKINYHIEYNLTSLDFYVSYAGGISIKYRNAEKLSEEEIAVKLLKLFYKLLDKEIKDIEKILKITISDKGITDKIGNSILSVIL